ncbi:MAG: hypothetical protein EBU49_09925 [Proteobacteria bacterium]|nr:hypothetical protein [Pseudomonadota bacterium]
MADSESLSQLVIETATMAEEQVQAIRQVHSGLDQIDQVTQANAAGAEESSSSAEELAELAARQDQLQALLRKVEAEKNVLRKLLARAEMMCKALDEKAPFEEVLSEMREKKYTDARSLLTRGLSVARVATEVELSEAEVRLLAGVTAAPTKSF